MAIETPLETQLEARKESFTRETRNIREKMGRLGDEARQELTEELGRAEAAWQRAIRFLHEQPSLARSNWEEAEQRLADIKRRMTL
ncbi:MAG: hypothetical protein E1N59_1359 [Puniceicoccaceae bacterium 5H]|nr:MAG: hypothetical protein E1N59_1359 [Puniceicoccaceae bacterium 5H]